MDIINTLKYVDDSKPVSRLFFDDHVLDFNKLVDRSLSKVYLKPVFEDEINKPKEPEPEPKAQKAELEPIPNDGEIHIRVRKKKLMFNFNN